MRWQRRQLALQRRLALLPRPGLAACPQAMVGLLLGAGLSVGGFVRVYVTNGGLANSAAIAASLFLIVMTSVVTGTLLPFGLARVGVDPANAGAGGWRAGYVSGPVAWALCGW